MKNLNEKEQAFVLALEECEEWSGRASLMTAGEIYEELKARKN